MTFYSTLALSIFVISLLLVVLEERLKLRKSVPVLVGAGLIWVLAGIAESTGSPGHGGIEAAFRHSFLDFSELFFFVLAAVTFVNTLEERNVFDVLRSKLVEKGLSYRTTFWATGTFAFLLSPIADNLTTTLVMGSVAVSIGTAAPQFVTLACVNVVMAANAGGAFSPFGDITTLMVWQAGHLGFVDFFALFIPSLVTWLVPAFILSFFVPTTSPKKESEVVEMKDGACFVIALFLLTICLTVLFHQFLHLPPVMGMLFGLGLLKLYGYFVGKQPGNEATLAAFEHKPYQKDKVNIFKMLERVEWDTLMFFYGVITCIGGLERFGLLESLAHFLYEDLGATTANVSMGVLSSIVDNIPIMFAVLTMEPDMTRDQWLLITLTTGVGGSLLSVGSAAGVALMGQARGTYTFQSHFKWSWVILIGYFAGVSCHLLIQG